jgi:hypothetical protein
MEIDPPEVTARRAVTRARTAFLHQVPVKPEPVDPHGVPEQSTDEPEQSQAIGDSEDDGRMVRHSRYIVSITSNGLTALSAADSGQYSCPPRLASFREANPCGPGLDTRCPGFPGLSLGHDPALGRGVGHVIGGKSGQGLEV